MTTATTLHDDTTYLTTLLKRTVWGAVIAGAAGAIAIQMLFSVLGIAIGATSIDPSASTNGIGIAAGLWWLVTGTIALYVGGCIVGRLAGTVRSPDVLLHAFLMWTVTAIVGFSFLTGAAGLALDNTPSAYLSRSNDPRAQSDARSGDLPGRFVPVSDDARVKGDNREAEAQDREDVRRNVRAAAWWTLLALLTGIAVSLGGAWTTSPNRIVVRPSNDVRPNRAEWTSGTPESREPSRRSGT